jgi:hypothetical protein
VHQDVCEQGNDQAPPIGEKIKDRQKGCQVCKTLLADMSGRLVGLSSIKRRGAVICGDHSGDSLEEFTHLLTRHQQMQDELAHLRAALAIHQQSHNFSSN